MKSDLSLFIFFAGNNYGLVPGQIKDHAERQENANPAEDFAEIFGAVLVFKGVGEKILQNIPKAFLFFDVCGLGLLMFIAVFSAHFKISSNLKMGGA